MTMRTASKILGYTLIILSCLAWALIPAIPFLDLSTTTKASWAGGLFIFAEVTWWLAMPLLGPEIMALIRQWWPKFKIWLRAQLPR